MDTPKFRSVEDIKRWIIQQSHDLNEQKQVVDILIKQLHAKVVKAAGIKIFDISGNGGKKNRTMNVDFPVVKVPNIDKLKNHYAVAERLSEQYKLIINTENEIKLNFKGATVKNATTDSYQAMLGAMTKLKTDIEDTLRSLFTSLAEVANGHAPPAYLNFVEDLAQTLGNKEHLQCKSVKSMTYAALDGEALVFAGYIILQEVMNDEGRSVPHLYIVVKWIVGGDVEIYVEPEFVAPSLLTGGKTIGNMKDAVLAVERQLTLEGFSSQLGNLPAELQLRAPAGGLRREAFSAAEHIKDVKAEKDELIFILDTHKPEEIEEIKNQIYLEVKSMLKRKRSTTVRMKPEGNKLTFSFANLDHDGGIHPADLEFLSDKYGLKNAQMRKISNIINGD